MTKSCDEMSEEIAKWMETIEIRLSLIIKWMKSIQTMMESLE